VRNNTTEYCDVSIRWRHHAGLPQLARVPGFAAVPRQDRHDGEFAVAR
jgi:hypothetical protein